MTQIPIHKLMTQHVELLSPATPLHSVAHAMQSKRHSCVVLGEDKIPAGIITERDLVSILGRILDEPELANEPAANFMSTPPCTVDDKQTLFDALVISRADGVRHLPVVNNSGKLVGLITQTDLAQAHFQVIEEQQHVIERAIHKRTEQLVAANAELQSLSMEDGLLHIGNRRAMEVDMEHTHARAVRYNQTYTTVLLDVDFFKAYNDHYGHMAGDDALKQTASIVKSAIRKSDRVYRYGGEELLLLLPDTGPDGGAILTQRILKALQDTAITHCKSPYGVITMSAGIANHDPEQEASATDWSAVVHAADQRLYQAKEAGRNRVA
ncbi:diguanylate cyclase (GGDEF)-like protein [Thiogranum longum]|uniref:diguanylate cyclase n=1 Tax=Thiogranum longum TaxID=1537524 RepID=A0A4R1HFH6_9GAMM|nr:GGDEF domain-containing protein [Thiogranum longum]TCK19105.1 diguanylate cyclase (GGDEF)-like protein [Thiogranum longum]